MRVFLDFEASSLGKRSYPIEVAWVFEDGRSETHLIRPAATWTDWDPQAQAIHRIDRQRLIEEGEPVDAVARRMADVLGGHELFASAPSWDGKWLSALLRAGGLPRGTLKLRDTDDARREDATAILAPFFSAGELRKAVEDLLVLSEVREPGMAPAHRALPDAEAEHHHWRAIRTAAEALAAQMRSRATSG